MLTTIVSGGQKGVDIAAWRAARACGLKTFGYLPAGFRTLEGNRPEYAEMYGAVALTSRDWPARTRANVEASDATLLLGPDLASRGSRATLDACYDIGKRCFSPGLPICRTSGRLLGPGERGEAGSYHTGAIWFRNLVDWIMGSSIRTLNVAGNRDADESLVEAWLCEVFREVLTRQQQSK